MEDYVFVCIGTNKLLSDSFGPRVGEILQNNVCPKLQVFGTMKMPIHFKNAQALLEKLKKENKEKVIVIDSAFSKTKQIRNYFCGYRRHRNWKGLWQKLLFSSSNKYKNDYWKSYKSIGL